MDGETPVELYYDRENVYEKTQEGEWNNRRGSIKEMHSLFLIDYQMLVPLLELIEPKEETAF